MLRPYIIGVLSQKGGVGKTTISVNLAVALKMMNKRVLIIDADTDNPTVGLHLGMEAANIGFEDLVAKGAKLGDVVTVHGSTGVHCILGTLHTRPFQILSKHVELLFDQLENRNYDFVIVDTAPGLQQEEDMMPFDEAAIVATPDLPALTSALRLGEELNDAREKYSLVLNRVTGKSYELRMGEIEEAWSGSIVASLPEDMLVSESLAARIPAYLSSGSSPFTMAVKRLAEGFISKAERLTKRGPQFANWKRGVAERTTRSAEEARMAASVAVRKEEEAQLKQLAERMEKQREEAEADARREIERIRMKTEKEKAEMERKLANRKKIEERRLAARMMATEASSKAAMEKRLTEKKQEEERRGQAGALRRSAKELRKNMGRATAGAGRNAARKKDKAAKKKAQQPKAKPVKKIKKEKGIKGKKVAAAKGREAEKTGKEAAGSMKKVAKKRVRHLLSSLQAPSPSPADEGTESTNEESGGEPEKEGEAPATPNPAQEAAEAQVQELREEVASSGEEDEDDEGEEGSEDSDRSA